MAKTINHKGILTALLLLLAGTMGFAQTIEKEAPKGFDQIRAGIANGKIDTISYPSKTVGTPRR